MSNTRLPHRIVGLMLAVLLLAGCGGAKTQPTATSAPPTATLPPASPTATSAPPTATVEPASPTATSVPPTSTPLSLSALGQIAFMSYSQEEGVQIYAMNADGSDGQSLTMEKALDLEYRFTARAMEHGDFIEGIRAAIIDKDRAPKWQFADRDVPMAAVSKMLRPLGKDALKL